MRKSLVLLLLVSACAARGDGPQPIAWDREPCGGCRMLVSEPSFAAQAVTADGRVTSFDDPGCLLVWLEGRGDAPRLWFHHLREDRWLAGDAVAFVAVPRTPMGYRLGAVDAATPGAFPLAEAARRARGGAHD